MSSLTFVLIAGAWHSSLCWQRIIPLLEEQGHRVISPELLGVGSDHTPLSQISLTVWVNQVVNIVEEQQNEVILVGHSRGGIIISQVAQRVPEKIKLLVYLTAFLIPSGETLSSTTVKVSGNKQLVVSHLDGTLTLEPDMVVPAFYNTTAPEWIEQMPRLLSPEPTNIYSTPLELTDDRFGRVPRAYIECSRDNVMPLTLQRSMEDRLPCQHVITMPTDHSPFFSAPFELVTNLLDLAAREYNVSS